MEHFWDKKSQKINFVLCFQAVIIKKNIIRWLIFVDTCTMHCLPRKFSRNVCHASMHFTLHWSKGFVNNFPILYLCIYSLSKFKWKHQILLSMVSVKIISLWYVFKEIFFLLVLYCLYRRLIFITLWTEQSTVFV